MVDIKLTSCCPNWNWIRQTPNSDGVWEGCRFACNTQVKTCDYWIVYENLSKTETISCPPQNTILVTGEPPTVKSYHPKFLAQFGTIITCHTTLKHPNVTVSHLSLPWMVGFQPPSTQFTKSYSELSQIIKYPKTKLVSVICSNKKPTRGHKKRLEFVKKLQKHFGDTIDFYGRGFKTITNKWDAIAPYKYHIALENSAVDHYWTEKIADSYLAQSYPIYYGCPNIHDYFPLGALTAIDIKKPAEACRIIERVIISNRYEQSMNSLKKAKELVLNTYNIFPRMAQLCTKTNASKKNITLQPHDYFYKNDPISKKIVHRVKYFFTRRTP